MLFTIERCLPALVPPAAAWEALADLPSWPAWRPAVVSLAPLDGATDADCWRPGRRWRERVRRWIFRPTFDLAVVAREEGWLVAWEGAYLFMRGRHAWAVQPAGHGCLLIDRETFWGPAPVVLAARAIFRLFRVRAMADAANRAWAAEAGRRVQRG